MNGYQYDGEYAPVQLPDPLLPTWLFWLMFVIVIAILIFVGIKARGEAKMDRDLEEFLKDPDHPRWNSTFSKRPNDKKEDGE